jgi:hypothetical protein
MGDIGTHAKIAAEVIALMTEKRPNEEYIFFEVGNWFTDTSQMRDPFAHVSGKATIWKTARATAKGENALANLQLLADLVLDLSYELDGYLNELMGVPGPLGGLLASYFLDVFFIWGLEQFRRQGVDPDEFEELFSPPTTERLGSRTAIMTQYWPHEHVDFPPWPFHNVIGERISSSSAVHVCAESPASGGRGRKLYQYTEDQLVYIADLLTLIERRWARKLSRQNETEDQKRDRHYLITRFGHASHAVEDFFFHSNFTEIAWNGSGARLPDQGSAPDSGSGRDPSEDNMTPLRENRIFQRRLRAPRGHGDDLDTAASDPNNQVFTGYFAAKDMFHTIMDAIKGLLARADKAANVANVPDFLSGMIASMLPDIDAGSTDPAVRKRKLTEKKNKQKAYLDSGYYTNLADLAQAREAIQPNSGLHPKSVQRVHNMCQKDLDLWNKYPKVDLGISGFVMQVLDEAQLEHLISEKRAADIDTLEPGAAMPDGRDPLLSTDNGASAENIGSHTLMAKDSERKRPLRQQAFNVACGTALYVAATMVDESNKTLSMARSTNDPPTTKDGGDFNTVNLQNLDWLHLLQHFVCHPDEAVAVGGATPWWQIQMADPDHSKTGHRIKTIDEGTVQLRMQETMREQLEEKYTALAEAAEAEWRALFGHEETGALIGGIAGAVLGAVAGAMAGAALGSALGPAGAIIGGIVGGIIGAIVGGVIGALTGGAVGNMF